MENNYVFKDSAPNTIENAYFDNSQPKIPFSLSILFTRLLIRKG